MEVLIETCCGIDVHQKSIVCCILDGPLESNKPKKIQKKFGTTTIALQNALAWILENHVTHVFFESTGQYWVPLFNIFSDSELNLILANPQHIKNVPGRKTDKIDAEKLAKSQLVHNRKPTYVQEEVYQHLRDLSRFYQNMTEDLVRAKNRLHKVLQVTFPELENLLSTPTGEQYWNLVMAFPCKEFVLSLSQSDLCEIIRQSISKCISEKRIAYLTDKLIKLSKQSFCAVKKTSPMLEEVRYYAQELLRLSERRQVVLNDMVALAQPLPEYDILRSIPGIAETTATSIIGELGDIRRFQSTNQINAFIGIDLRHYESGNFLAKEHITKRGNPYTRKILFKSIHNIDSASHTNPCHIADFYEKRKRQSQVTSTKPHTIASIHRLIRTIYYLITHNKLYDYSLTQNR